MPRADDEGFEAFFSAEYAGVVASVRWIVRSDEIAEEVAQDAFCKAYERWKRVRVHECPGAWVQLVALRMATRSVKRRARGDGLRAAWVPASTVRPVDLDLVRAIAALSERQRLAVVLHHVLDLPVAEAASVMGVREGTVKTLLSRGRARLAIDLADPDEAADDA